MGRLIKNFDREVLSRTFRAIRLGVHRHAGTQSLRALDHHAFALFQPIRNNPLGTDPVADFHCSHIYFVLRVHHGDLIAALQFRHSALGNQQRIFLDSNSGTNFAVAAGTQNISRVGEQSSEPDRAGALIHLTVRKIKAAWLCIGQAVRQNQLEL
jgi:hypothetical protein